MIIIKYTHPVNGPFYRDLSFFCKFFENILCTRNVDSMSCQYIWFFGLIDELCSRFEIFLTWFSQRSVGPDLFYGFVQKIKRFGLCILGDVDQHRTGASTIGDIERDRKSVV